VPTLGVLESLQTGEQALRDLITAAMRAARGDSWIEHLKADYRNKWRERRAKEESRRGSRGVADLPQSDLAYAELDEIVANPGLPVPFGRYVDPVGLFG